PDTAAVPGSTSQPEDGSDHSAADGAAAIWKSLGGVQARCQGAILLARPSGPKGVRERIQLPLRLFLYTGKDAGPRHRHESDAASCWCGRILPGLARQLPEPVNVSGQPQSASPGHARRDISIAIRERPAVYV